PVFESSRWRAAASADRMAGTLAPRCCEEKVTEWSRKDKRREVIAAFAWPSLPAAYEVSCRIRAGSPTSLRLDSPRTVASRLVLGPPFLGAVDSAARPPPTWRPEECTPARNEVNGIRRLRPRFDGALATSAHCW